MKLYKIRHTVTNKYSKGGSYVPANGQGSLWTDEGRSKSWDTIGKLRSHLTSHINRHFGSTDMSEWEVVEYNTIVNDVKPVHEVVKPERLLQMLKA